MLYITTLSREQMNYISDTLWETWGFFIVHTWLVYQISYGFIMCLSLTCMWVFINMSVWFVLWLKQLWFQRTAVSIRQSGLSKFDLTPVSGFNISQSLLSITCWQCARVCAWSCKMHNVFSQQTNALNVCVYLFLYDFVWSFLSEFKICFISLVFCKVAVLSGSMCKNCCYVMYVTF